MSDFLRNLDNAAAELRRMEAAWAVDENELAIALMAIGFVRADERSWEKGSQRVIFSAGHTVLWTGRGSGPAVLSVSSALRIAREPGCRGSR